MLVKAKGLTKSSFVPVAHDGQLDVFFTDYKPQAGLILSTGCSQQEKSLAIGFANRVFKHITEIPGIEEPQFPGKTVRRHNVTNAYALIR